MLQTRSRPDGRIADFVEELLERMGIDAIAEPTTTVAVYVDIVDGPEDDMALLIGRHGQTLDAIQELARTSVGRRLDDRIRVLVDVGDYRKRAERLVEQAKRSPSGATDGRGGALRADERVRAQARARRDRGVRYPRERVRGRRS